MLPAHYNYFRDYDPRIGRYVQSDPIGLNGGLNTFGYVGARPLQAIDPLGLEIVCKDFIRYHNKLVRVLIQDEIGEWNRNCSADPKMGMGPPDPLDGPPRKQRGRPPLPMDFEWRRKCSDWHYEIVRPAKYEYRQELWQHQWQECRDTCTGKEFIVTFPDKPASR